MTPDQWTYLLPYLTSLAISLGVFIYTLKHRRSQGALPFIGYVGGQTLWVLGFILEMVSPTLQGKLLWDKMQWLASLAIPIAFPIFAVQYTAHKLKHPKTFLPMLLAVPIVFYVLVVSDGFQHFLYPDPHLNSALPFSELEYTLTPVVYGYAIYSFLVLMWGLSLLANRLFRPQKLYRAQVAAIMVGFIIPVLGFVLVVLGIQFTPQRDPTPLTTALGNLVIAWGLFRFRIFQVTPVGRDTVFESMIDPVVILNRKHDIIDINRAMLDLLGKRSEDVIGHSAKVIFADFPIPIKMYTDVSYARTEATFPIGGTMVFYELTVWPIFDQDKKITGRVYVSHDITALKELEGDLRGLNQVLEVRVQDRTKELAEAYDTTLEGWARALELRDKETEGHSRRVTETTLKIARALEIPEDEIIHIHRGALLHDIGKMAIPDDILRKPGPLTEAERAIVQKHPEIAHQLLGQIPFLHKALDIPYCHHEKWDGTGYPRGLKGRTIPLAARIFAVADVWDAVQSRRPYNSGWSREKALDYLKEQTGKHFDPRVMDIFIRLIEKGEI